jgi:hypothetical protein
MNFNKIVRTVIITAVILVIIIVMIALGNIAFFVSIFNWLQRSIHNVTGLDSTLAKGIAAFLVAVVIAFPLFGMVMSFMPIPQKNKGWYRAAVFTIVAAFFLFKYFGGQNVYFNPTTGLPEKYYSIGLQGEYRFFSEPGYDPVTGDKLKTVTREIIEKFKKPPKPKLEPSPPIIINQVKPTPPPIAAPPPAPKVEPIAQYQEPVKDPEPVSENIPAEANYSPPSNTETSYVAVPEKPKYCQVTFNNAGDITISVYDKQESLLFSMMGGNRRTEHLLPGNYYFKPFDGDKLQPFVVSNQETETISLRAMRNDGQFESRSVQNNESYGPRSNCPIDHQPYQGNARRSYR